MIDPGTYARSVGDDVDALLAAVTDLEAPVPTCPGWTVRDLVRHTGKVHRWATGCLQSPPDEPVGRPRGPAAGVDPLAWFREGADALVATMRTVDVTTPVHTWAGTRPAGWWVRRLAHETAIHRWDAQAAAGETRGFPTELATDGVAEVFEEFLVFADPSQVDGRSGSLHLHVTDAPDGAGEWYVRWSPDGVAAEPVHRKADAALRAPAAEAFLVLWRRRDAVGLDVVGDQAALDDWRAILAV